MNNDHGEDSGQRMRNNATDILLLIAAIMLAALIITVAILIIALT